MNLKLVSEQLDQLARRWLPRILTQLDRDPTSSTYGCADRNWWHYKIRDFPSIILQQAGYAVALAARDVEDPQTRDAMTRLAAASASFWNARAIRKGAFEEYYPWEQGYPPLAFSTLAVMKLAAAGVISPAAIHPGASVAVGQLARRFEHQAANQQVAGLAAWLWMRKVQPSFVQTKDGERLISATLGLQHEEGWFEEYGGPDLGYLSVTIDCLWDAYDASGDDRLLASARRALRYIDTMTALTGANIGMHNARNTDYIVPYGIARFARETSADGEVGRRLMARLYQGLGDPAHALHATDDRYLCHYIGASMIRAAQILREDPAALVIEPAPTPATGVLVLPGSGHALHPPTTEQPVGAIVSLKKGGIVTLVAPDGSAASDFGWSMASPKGRLVTHWWSDQWQSGPVENGWRISGHWVPCREHLSTPWKHMALRLASFVLGRRLIGVLKKTVIFKSRLSPIRFERVLRLTRDGAVIDDTITGLPVGLTPEPAPRASRRHVASADSHHLEDVAPDGPGWSRQRSIRAEPHAWIARTTFSYRPHPG